VLRRMGGDRLSSAVIILSARGEEWDRVQGFEFGADDYVVKPFSTRELLMRIRALLRRSDGATPGLALEGGKLRFGEVVVDFAAYSLERAGVRHGLSRRELELLRFFLAQEGKTLERSTILAAGWRREEGATPR